MTPEEIEQEEIEQEEIDLQAEIDDLKAKAARDAQAAATTVTLTLADVDLLLAPNAYYHVSLEREQGRKAFMEAFKVAEVDKQADRAVEKYTENPTEETLRALLSAWKVIRTAREAAAEAGLRDWA